MNTLLLNIPNLPCRIIVNSQGSGIHYKYIHADSVSLPSLTRSRVYPSIEKIVAGHRRPHLSKKHSSILLQAQTNNALTELNENEQSDLTIKQRLQELADSLVLPPNYLIQLPNDLRLDLNDAAFDLASGPMNQECGVKFGEILMQLSQAWEKADTQGAAEIASLLPSLQDSLTANVEAAIGRRLIRAGRRFASMGQYGQGELQKIAKSMIAAGEALARNSSSAAEQRQPIEETRTLKFGTLQVELTSKKAYIGSIIALVFGTLSWQFSAAVQSIPEYSLQYANDNALLLAKSLRGALLAICYSSTILSGFTTVGLILFGRQLSSEGK
ncbi:hypothetical protein SUGI_0471690 [Cryptomeria japonica]|nr:hypothetical protein SUGI_0471690 [Cryptomeria japonica]